MANMSLLTFVRYSLIETHLRIQSVAGSQSNLGMDGILSDGQSTSHVCVKNVVAVSEIM